MNLKDRISDDIKTAMKARDKERTTVLRMVLSEIKYAQVAEGVSEELSDEQVTKVVAAYEKKQRKALEDFRGTDKVADIEKELAIIQEYLPKKANSEEISQYIDQLLKTTEDRNFGSLMKMVLAHFSNAVDGKEVSQLLKSRLS